MDNITMIPYSAEAVNNLVAIEREHQSFLYNITTGEALCSSLECETAGLDMNENYTITYPCPTLLDARAKASPETLIAVALRLGGSNG